MRSLVRLASTATYADRPEHDDVIVLGEHHVMDVAGSAGSPDLARDVRGFAVKGGYLGTCVLG